MVEVEELEEAVLHLVQKQKRVYQQVNQLIQALQNQPIKLQVIQ